MSILFPEPSPQVAVPPPAPRQRRTLGPRARRLLKFAAIAAGVLAIVWAGALAFLNSEGFKKPLQERMRAELRQRTERVELGDELRIDWLGRVRLGPILLRGTPGAEPFLEIPSIRVRPSYRNLLVGRVVPAAITLERPTLRLGRRAEELRAFVRDLQADRPQKPRPPGPPPKREPHRESAIALFTERLQVIAGAQSGVPVTGPLDASFFVHDDEAGDLHIRARIAFPDGGHGRLTIDETSGHFTVDAELTALTPSAIHQTLWKALPIRAERGTFEAGFRFAGADFLAPAKASIRFAVRDTSVSGQRLAPRPVGPASFGFSADLAWNPQQRRVRMAPAKAWIGSEDSVFVALQASVGFTKPRSFDFEAKVDNVAFEKMVEALPPQVRPDEAAPSAKGPVRASLTIRGPIDTPEAWEVQPVLDLDDLRPLRRGRNLLGPFEHTTVDAQGRTRNLVIDPENGSYVPLAQLPEFVVRSVLTSEDAGFFGHDGFEFTEIHDSLIAAVRGTRFRGASTLTQQLAKNLFLSREKTLARKVEEALITLALEVSVPKERLLEIYLNLIEWGPNLYGIREASRHYFGVEPQQLSPKQAVFLATIIPNPNRYYGYYLKGQLTPVWEERVKTLLTKLRDAGYLDEGRYQAALVETLVFHKPANQAPAAR